MHEIILFLHSIFRWFVFLFLSYAIFQAYRGYRLKRNFSKWDNKIRHWTATTAHIQLILGILVYIKSPLIIYYFSNFKNLVNDWNFTFFGLFHIILMFFALVIITIGSAKTKRKKTDQEKYKTMFLWFLIAFIIIFIAIPWPFSPLANRPYFRTI
jgi:heme A synthase